jgi:hypothetical protein
MLAMSEENNKHVGADDIPLLKSLQHGHAVTSSAI